MGCFLTETLNHIVQGEESGWNRPAYPACRSTTRRAGRRTRQARTETAGGFQFFYFKKIGFLIKWGDGSKVNTL